jgi:hypothetical protein
MMMTIIMTTIITAMKSLLPFSSVFITISITLVYHHFHRRFPGHTLLSSSSFIVVVHIIV